MLMGSDCRHARLATDGRRCAEAPARLPVHSISHSSAHPVTGEAGETPSVCRKLGSRASCVVRVASGSGRRAEAPHAHLDSAHGSQVRGWARQRCLRLRAFLGAAAQARRGMPSAWRATHGSGRAWRQAAGLRRRRHFCRRRRHGFAVLLPAASPRTECHPVALQAPYPALRGRLPRGRRRPPWPQHSWTWHRRSSASLAWTRKNCRQTCGASRRR